MIFAKQPNFVSQMNSGVLGESWFLAWGTRIGDTGVRLRARLYALDGRSVRTVWHIDELTFGEIKVSKDSVILEYDKVYISELPDNHVPETLRITSEGLQ